MQKQNELLHIVLLSGGLASFEACRRVIEKYKEENIEFWFFDTRMEDEDLYRFLEDIETTFKIRIKRLIEGRNPWQVFLDKRYIGNSRVDVCSRILKRELLENNLRSLNGQRVKLYFGLEWSEGHRIEAVRKGWKQKGYETEFPLTWEPILFPQDFRAIVEGLGIKIPRLYDLGFVHNNCGGACVKAGMQQWYLLYKHFPERYLWHEQQEQLIRKRLRKNVSILRTRAGGKIRPVTLRYLRWKIKESKFSSGSLNALFKRSVQNDAACSCFTQSISVT